MNKVATVETQKYISNFDWNEINFNKYLIKFYDDEKHYTINRQSDIEQSLIDASLLYTVGNFYHIKNYKILCYEEQRQYRLVSLDQLKEIAWEMVKKILKEKQKVS